MRPRLVLAILGLLAAATAWADPEGADQGPASPAPAAGARYTDPTHPFSLVPPAGYRRLHSPPANIVAQWIDQRRDLSVAVAWSRLDTTAWKGTSKLTLRVALEAGMRLSTRGFRKIAARAFDHGELPGYEIEYEFEGEGGRVLRTLMRYYFTGDGQYMALAMGPPARFVAARAELVEALDSLEVKATWKGGWGGKGGFGAAQVGALLGVMLISVVALVIWLVARGGSRRPAPTSYGPGAYRPPGSPPYGVPGSPPYGVPGSPPRGAPGFPPYGAPGAPPYRPVGAPPPVGPGAPSAGPGAPPAGPSAPGPSAPGSTDDGAAR